jgi:hypothetical protein
MITRFITKRNGTPAVPGAKTVSQIQCHGSPVKAQTFNIQKGQPIVTTGRILTEADFFLNTESSNRLTVG